MLLTKVISSYKGKGIKFTFEKIKNKLFRSKIKNYKNYQELLSGKNGIEIGGLSNYFTKHGLLPIYHVINSIDGVNFSNETIWEGKLEKGQNYKFTKNKIGYQYICDAVDLSAIYSSKYDFTLSCNSLEHIANPLKAITEWLRVLKPDGVIVLVIPRKESNFDHNRATTTFNHLKADHERDTKEDDLSHVDEILKLHDLSLDTPAGNLEQFKARSLDNHNNRCLHQHVFDMKVLKEIFNYFNIEELQSNSTNTDYIIAGRKKHKVE